MSTLFALYQGRRFTMNKVGKIVKWIVLVIVVIIAALVLTFYFAGNNIIKNAAEYGGTKALGVNVTVGGVDLSLLKARFGISGVTVANPAGYETKNMLTLGSLTVNTSYRQLRSDPVEIQEIVIDDVQITLEQKGMSNNIKDVLNGMSKTAPAKEEPKAEPTAGEKPAKNLKIKRLEIKGASVQAKLIGGPVTFKLDPIVMNDLGSDEPMDTAALSGKILAALVAGIVKQGGGLLPADITDAMGKSLDEAKAILGQGSELLKSGAETGKGLGEGIKDAGESVKKGLEGLFKPKEE
jgi:hypothetical protein